MNANSLDAALNYVRRRWPVFPCHWTGTARKRPLTPHGLHDASADPGIIATWWRRWPDALIGLPTGQAIGAVVLDIDVKDGRANGFDSLAELGFAILPETPTAHTPGGGLHLYFALPAGTSIRNTAGRRGRGIGPGLDWRGDGGYVIAPGVGRYEWDTVLHLDAIPLEPVPTALLPRQRKKSRPAAPLRPTCGLSRYGEAALDSACRAILAAPAGEQEATLNTESFAIGTLAGAGGIPADFARRALIWAARQMRDHDPRRPWRPAEIEAKVVRAFDEGLRHPREARRA
jgi:hypothetical protein